MSLVWVADDECFFVSGLVALFGFGLCLWIDGLLFVFGFICLCLVWFVFFTGSCWLCWFVLWVAIMLPLVAVICLGLLDMIHVVLLL